MCIIYGNYLYVVHRDKCNATLAIEIFMKVSFLFQIETYRLEDRERRWERDWQALQESEQDLSNHKLELERLRKREEANLQRMQALQADQDALVEAEKKLKSDKLKMEEEQGKLSEENVEMSRRIAELEVLLEEEKASHQLVVEPDLQPGGLDTTISVDPAVVASAEGAFFDFPDYPVFPDLFDFSLFP